MITPIIGRSPAFIPSSAEMAVETRVRSRCICAAKKTLT